MKNLDTLLSRKTDQKAKAEQNDLDLELTKNCSRSRRSWTRDYDFVVIVLRNQVGGRSSTT